MTRIRKAVRVISGSALFGLLAVIAILAIGSQTVAAAQGQLSVRVTSPTMNANVSASLDMTLALAAEADAPGGTIAKVEFFDGTKLIGTATQAPFQTTYSPGKKQLNYTITAKVTDTAGRSAVSLPVTCVATSSLTRQYDSYDYEETVDVLAKNATTPTPTLKQVRITIPKGLTTVRGVFVFGNGAGGDQRDSYRPLQYSEFMFLHDFAYLGTKGFGSSIGDFQVMQNALKDVAKRSNHPELLNAPYVTSGFSNGGAIAGLVLSEATDRVIACAPISSRMIRNVPRNGSPDINPLSAAIMATPTLEITGEMEKTINPIVEPVLAAYRPKGALFGWMALQGYGHAWIGQEVLLVPMLDAAIRLRYPANADVRKGPIKLKAVNPAAGWIADNTTWESGLTVIAPIKQFKGDIAKSSWLLNKDIAFIYRAYSTYDSPLTIASPPFGWVGLRAWDPGSNVTIVVDDSKFPNWKKMEFFDQSRKLGEVTSGAAQLTAMNLTAGFHVFSVLGTDAQGTIRTSDPVLVIVRKLPAS